MLGRKKVLLNKDNGMKNPNKKIMIVMCAVLLAQFGSTVHGGPIQRLKDGISNLRSALKCIDTNSCSPDQQAYIKSMTKKLAVGVVAAAVACGVYATFKSTVVASDIIKIFGVTKPRDQDFLRELQKYGWLVKAGKQDEANALSNKISDELGDVSGRGLLAAEYMYVVGEGKGFPPGILTSIRAKLGFLEI